LDIPNKWIQRKTSLPRLFLNQVIHVHAIQVSANAAGWTNVGKGMKNSSTRNLDFQANEFRAELHFTGYFWIRKHTRPSSAITTTTT
jgi:hypothetical protein